MSTVPIPPQRACTRFPVHAVAWVVLAVLLLAPLALRAQCSGISAPPMPFAWEVLTIGAVPQALTPAKYQPVGSAANMAMVSIEGGDIRYLVVGIPTSTDGHPVGSSPPQTFFICGLDSIKAFKAIRVTTDAKATISYYKPKSP
jgi:hypothetical protein